MKRVLHILGSAGMEGAGIARQVGLLAAELSSEFQFRAVFLGGGGPMVGELARAGVAAGVLRYQGVSHGPSLLRLVSLARRFDVVHQHFGGVGLRLALAASGSRVVNHLHGCIAESGRLSPLAGARLGAAATVATSWHVASHLTSGGGARARVHVVYPATRQEQVCAANGPLIAGFAGRLVPLKGLAVALDAVARLKSRGLKIELEIAGDGPARQSAGCAGARCLGWLPDLAGCWPRWTMFLQPSRHEGFGITALEAMAAGVPVIASRTGGLTELVTGVDGVLVSPGSAQELAAAIARLASDTRLRDSCRTAGLARAELFRPERSAAVLRSIYRQLTCASPSRRP